MNEHAYYAMVKRKLGTPDILSKGAMMAVRIDGKHNCAAPITKEDVHRLHPVIGKDFCNRFLQIAATPCMMFGPMVNRTDIIIMDDDCGTWSATFMWQAQRCLMMVAHGPDIIDVLTTMPKHPEHRPQSIVDSDEGRSASSDV